MKNAEYVVIARLDSLQGFLDMSSVLNIAHELQNKGINAIAEKAPGSPLDGLGTYYIKVPLAQKEAGEVLLAEIMHSPQEEA